MNVARIAIPREQAREKLRAVRSVLHRRADAEYQALEQAYEQAAAGKELIQLSDAVRNAPRDEKGRPRLAIARADRRQVEVRINGWQDPRRCLFKAVSPNAGRQHRDNPSLAVAVEWPGDAPEARGFALVPIVPADVIEKITPKALNGYHILFEVEAWADTRLGARPDIDPYLLRHVGGDLWAVVAEWELTAIERAVMAGRAQG
jgi:hypothetical protein